MAIPLKEAAARAVLGLILPDDLPEIATHALAAHESESLAVLAGSSANRETASELWELWWDALRELQLPPPTVDEAVELLIDLTLRDYLRGRIQWLTAIDCIAGLHDCSDLGRDKRFAGESLGVQEVLSVWMIHGFGPETRSAEAEAREALETVAKRRDVHVE